MTEFDKMKAHWERNSALRAEGKTGTNKPIGHDVDLGGCIVELDWERKAEVRQLSLSCPSGLEYDSGNTVVASMRRNELYILGKSWVVDKTLSSPLFNDIHSVTRSKNGLLVTSTGLDAIIEVGLTGDILWSWYAFQNGYNLDQFGNERSVDLAKDHRLVDHPTLYQTTHVNSAVEDPQNPDVLYASLFHQGQILRIHKRDGQRVVRAGLRNCHSVRYTKGTFTVADTRGGRVLICDQEFHPLYVIPVGVNWLADALLTSKETCLIADASACRILEVNLQGQMLSEFAYDSNWRIFQMLEISEA